jgi:hypothetical protein
MRDQPRGADKPKRRHPEALWYPGLQYVYGTDDRTRMVHDRSHEPTLWKGWLLPPEDLPGLAGPLDIDPTRGRWCRLARVRFSGLR